MPFTLYSVIQKTKPGEPFTHFISDAFSVWSCRSHSQSDAAKDSWDTERTSGRTENT